MKNVIYELVVDVWRLATGYGFRRMTEEEWEAFVDGGKHLVLKYRDQGPLVERLCRDLVAAFQEYYQQKEKEKSRNAGKITAGDLGNGIPV